MHQLTVWMSSCVSSCPSVTCLPHPQLLHVSLKRERIVPSTPEHVAMLDPFVPLLAMTIKSKHVPVSRHTYVHTYISARYCRPRYCHHCNCCVRRIECGVMWWLPCTQLNRMVSTCTAGSLYNAAVPAKDAQVSLALVVSPPNLLYTGAVLHPWTACTAWGCRWDQPGAGPHCLQDNDSCNQGLPGGGCV